jgi:hypothetical protein
MTVVDATNMLFDWFGGHDSFELEKDFMKIIPVTDTPEEDRSAFLCALEGFEQNGFVKSVEYKGVRRWILAKSYASYEQTITVGPDTCQGVALIINSMCDTIGEDTDRCEVTNIIEKDIRNLVGLTNYMTNQRAGEDINVDSSEKGK